MGRRAKQLDVPLAGRPRDIEGHLQHGDPTSDMELRAGDTITVPVRSGANLLEAFLRFSPLVTAATGLIIIFQR